MLAILEGNFGDLMLSHCPNEYLHIAVAETFPVDQKNWLLTVLLLLHYVL